jgi:hypothetical protein
MDGWDFSEVTRFAGELQVLPDAAEKALTEVVTAGGKDMQKQWRANARRTAGKHGRWYPSSITATPIDPLTVEVGPDNGKRQGGMGPGFEFGSINQPPHLDGTHALDGVGKDFARSVEDVAGTLLGSL